MGGSPLEATGGTVTTDGDFKVHTFTSSGTFAVANTNSSDYPVTYLIVAGGGGAGAGQQGSSLGGAGAGAGGMITGTLSPPSVASYSIVVGGGGTGDAEGNPNPARGDNGGTSSGFSLSTVGGGAGGTRFHTEPPEEGLMVALAAALRGKDEMAGLVHLDKAMMAETRTLLVGGLVAAVEKVLLGQMAITTLPALAETAQQVQSLGLL